MSGIEESGEVAAVPPRDEGKIHAGGSGDCLDHVDAERAKRPSLDPGNGLLADAHAAGDVALAQASSQANSPNGGPDSETVHVEEDRRQRFTGA